MDGKNYKKRARAWDSSNPYTKRGPTTNQIARAVMRKVVKNEEVKNVYVNKTALTADTTGACLNLFALTQGTGAAGRVGAKVAYKGISVDLLFRPTSASDSYVNWCLLYDKETNGAVPSVASVFEQANGMGQRTHIYKDRFITLKKGQVAYQDTDGTSGVAIKRWTFYVPLKGKPCKFNTGNAGTVADIQSGSLILAYSGSTAGGNAGDVTASVQFTDA